MRYSELDSKLDESDIVVREPQEVITLTNLKDAAITLGKLRSTIIADPHINLSRPDQDGYTLLFLAVQRMQSDVVFWLLDPNDAHYEQMRTTINFALPLTGSTPAHQAAINGDLTSLRILVAAGADLSIADREGNTPLMLALKNNKSEAAEYILDLQGAVHEKVRATINNADLQGKTAAHLAIEQRIPNLYKISQAISPQVIATCQPDNEGQTPLGLAVQAGDEKVVELLLESQEQPYLNYQSNKTGSTAVMVAVQKDQLSCVKLLVKANADLTIPDYQGHTPLIKAVINKKPILVKFLLALENPQHQEIERHINVRFAPNDETMVHRAITNKDLTSLRLLADNRADFSAQNAQGLTPLMQAIVLNQPDTVRFLLSPDNPQRATVITTLNQPYQSETPLSWAGKKSPHLLVMLMNAPEIDLSSLLWRMIKEDYPEEAITTLIKHGVDLSTVDPSKGAQLVIAGKEFLKAALSQKKFNAVALLLLSGAQLEESDVTSLQELTDNKKPITQAIIGQVRSFPELAVPARKFFKTIGASVDGEEKERYQPHYRAFIKARWNIGAVPIKLGGDASIKALKAVDRDVETALNSAAPVSLNLEQKEEARTVAIDPSQTHQERTTDGPDEDGRTPFLSSAALFSLRVSLETSQTHQERTTALFSLLVSSLDLSQTHQERTADGPDEDGCTPLPSSAALVSLNPEQKEEARAVVIDPSQTHQEQTTDGPDEDGRTRLREAVIHGHHLVIRFLLSSDNLQYNRVKQGINIRFAPKGQTLAHLAIENDDLKSLELLAAAGADFSILDDQGQTPLMQAFSLDRQLIISFLLKRDKDASIRKSINRRFPGTEETLVHKAVKSNDLYLLDLLAKVGANLGFDAKGKTPLYIAVEQRFAPVVTYLLSEGNPERNSVLATANWSYDAEMPVSLAIQNNDLFVIRALNQIPEIDLSSPNDKGITPLQSAVKKGFSEVVAELLRRHTPHTKRIYSTLDHRASGSRTAVYEALVAIPDQTENSHTQCARFLIKAGADLSIPDDSGITPLLYATTHQRWDLVLMLLQAALNPTNPNFTLQKTINDRVPPGNKFEGLTALYVMVMVGEKRFTSLLLAQGASLELSNGQQMLALALQNKQFSVVASLLLVCTKIDKLEDSEQVAAVKQIIQYKREITQEICLQVKEWVGREYQARRFFQMIGAEFKEELKELKQMSAAKFEEEVKEEPCDDGAIYVPDPEPKYEPFFDAFRTGRHGGLKVGGNKCIRVLQEADRQLATIVEVRNECPVEMRGGNLTELKAVKERSPASAKELQDLEEFLKKVEQKKLTNSKSRARTSAFRYGAAGSSQLQINPSHQVGDGSVDYYYPHPLSWYG